MNETEIYVLKHSIYTDEERILFKEHKSKITFFNRGNLKCAKICVDGGIFQKDTPPPRSIDNEDLNPCPNLEKKAFVVGKNHLPRTSPLIQKYEKRFHKKNTELMIGNSPHQENLP